MFSLRVYNRFKDSKLAQYLYNLLLNLLLMKFPLFLKNKSNYVRSQKPRAMKSIYLLHHKLTQSVLTVKSIYPSILIVALIVVSLVMSFTTINHTVQLWSGLVGGFTISAFMLKLPAIIAFLKKDDQKSAS